MEHIVDQIQSYTASLDEAGRGAAVRALDQQRRKMETPFHTIHRFFNGQMVLALAVTASDLGCFQALVDAPDGLTVEQLAQSSGAAVELLAKILRFLAPAGIIDEGSDGRYVASSMTRALTDPNLDGCLRFFQKLMGPAVQALPAHYKEQKYCAIDDMTTTALQAGFDTKESFWKFLQERPELYKDFHNTMKVERTVSPWYTAFPMQEQLQTWDRSKPFLVDVGGSLGHVCIALRDKYPELKDHLVLQDLPETIEAAGSVGGVQTMVHDFFTPQPIKDAKLYYLGHILHDWDDATCKKILDNLVPAMSPDSRILIDDVVVPEAGAPWVVTQEDMIIFSCLGTKERTRRDWETVLGSAGLQLTDVFTYGQPSGSSITMGALGSHPES